MERRTRIICQIQRHHRSKDDIRRDIDLEVDSSSSLRMANLEMLSVREMDFYFTYQVRIRAFRDQAGRTYNRRRRDPRPGVRPVLTALQHHVISSTPKTPDSCERSVRDRAIPMIFFRFYRQLCRCRSSEVRNLRKPETPAKYPLHARNNPPKPPQSPSSDESWIGWQPRLG
jgi:hypothetical protein